MEENFEWGDTLEKWIWREEGEAPKAAVVNPSTLCRKHWLTQVGMWDQGKKQRCFSVRRAILALFLTNFLQLLPLRKTKYCSFLAQDKILRSREKKKRGYWAESPLHHLRVILLANWIPTRCLLVIVVSKRSNPDVHILGKFPRKVFYI